MAGWAVVSQAVVARRVVAVVARRVVGQEGEGEALSLAFPAVIQPWRHDEVARVVQCEVAR